MILTEYVLHVGNNNAEGFIWERNKLKNSFVSVSYTVISVNVNFFYELVNVKFDPVVCILLLESLLLVNQLLARKLWILPIYSLSNIWNNSVFRR